MKVRWSAMPVAGVAVAAADDEDGGAMDR